jgi:glutamyl-tRNA reductase
MDVEEHDKAGLNAKTVQHKWVDNKVVCMGLSHKTASVEMREKLAVQEQDWQTVQREIKLLPDIREAAIISTCNRHEIYFVTTDLHSGIRVVTNYLSQKHNVSRKELLHSLFFLAEEEAVWHALRVAGGLDSLVIGEGQILSQMKKCYELSTAKEGAAGKVLSRMFNTAVSAGKRVRTETEIARGGVSISSAAVELVEKQCIPDLNLDMHQLDVCIIGAGKMARLLVQHLMPRKPKSLTIVNRGLQRIEELQTQFPDANIVPAPLDKMLDLVGSCHVCFACTGSLPLSLCLCAYVPVRFC